MLTKETALTFKNDINDGFVRPTLAWCATNAMHINEAIGSSITSNFWFGTSENVKPFAEKLVQFYDNFYTSNENLSELEEHESVSVAYWEKDGVAMCADLSTSDEFFDILPEELFEEAEQTLTMILGMGNDNHTGLILEQSELTVEDRLSLAKFMRYDETIWVTKDPYKEEYLPGFSEDDIEKLKENLAK